MRRPDGLYASKRNLHIPVHALESSAFDAGSWNRQPVGLQRQQLMCIQRLLCGAASIMSPVHKMWDTERHFPPMFTSEARLAHTESVQHTHLPGPVTLAMACLTNCNDESTDKW